MGYGKESPQEQRKRMISEMEFRLRILKPNEPYSIEEFKKVFMYQHGSSKVKTDEYFDLVVFCHRSEFEIKDGEICYKPTPKPPKPT